MDVSWLEILIVGPAANIITDIYEYLLERGLSFGVVTVLALWLILIPALGGGFFGVKTGRAVFVVLASLSFHAEFGNGLYLGTMVYVLI